MADPSPEIPGVIAFPPLMYGAAILAGLALDRVWPPAPSSQGLQSGLAGLPIAAAAALEARVRRWP